LNGTIKQRPTSAAPARVVASVVDGIPPIDAPASPPVIVPDPTPPPGSDLAQAIEQHRYVVRPGGPSAVGVTTVARVLGASHDGMIKAAVAMARENIDYQAVWDAKRDLGTRLHQHLETIARGLPDVPPPSGSEDHGYYRALRGFLDQTRQVWLEVEQIVLSGRPGLEYGGRFDEILELDLGDLKVLHRGHSGDAWEQLPKANWLLDLKTSAVSRPVEYSLQLAGYRFSEGIAVYNSQGQLSGTRPLPRIDYCGCLYLKPDGSFVVERYDADELDYKNFLALRELYEYRAHFSHGSKRGRLPDQNGAMATGAARER
jgi:hypothetical protein